MINRRHFVQSSLAAAAAYALPTPRLYALDQAASQAAGGLAAVRLDGSATVIDVRPRSEYMAAHIPGALSVPVNEVKRRLKDFPKSREVLAYCRGPYCVFSLDAVKVLRRNGYRARRADEGLPGWRLAGLPVAAGSE